MDDAFGSGLAFILEGDTEKEFYLSFLDFLCRKHGATFERKLLDDTPDVIYMIQKASERILVKFHNVTSISNMPRAGRWFTSQCASYYKGKHNWYVFLCYDTDNYKNDVTNFHEGDWAALRTRLKRATRIIDVAAAADIEDVMLQDLAGVCNFLGCAPSGVVLRGSKGKKKMQRLFREHGAYYHEGIRAKPLIDSLDMQLLIDHGKIPLREIEEICFQ